MPYKIGGGFKLEAYDPDNGQYTEEDKVKMLKHDKFWLFHCKSCQVITKGFEPHIPTKGIHDDKYAYEFIDHFKHYFTSPKIDKEKVKFLLGRFNRKDKANWIKQLGFYLQNKDHLTDNDLLHFANYIIENTDFTSIYFLKFGKDGCIICNALTTIKGLKQQQVGKLIMTLFPTLLH